MYTLKEPFIFKCFLINLFGEKDFLLAPNVTACLTMKEKHRLSPAYGMLDVVKVVQHNYGECMKGDWMEFRRLRD